MRKAVWTLNIGDYEPAITAVTYPLMQAWADKIDADWKIIKERRFPEWPITYEKLQLHTLGRGYDWNIYLDSDALVHPNMYDPTNHVSPDTVGHYGCDMAGHRWTYDEYFRRDGRHIGAGNWCTYASNQCLDLWHPLEDLTLEQAVARIHPTLKEKNSGLIPASHLLDDYVVSRNIARYGLKFKNLLAIQAELGISYFEGFWHEYLLSPADKLSQMKAVLAKWNEAK